MPPDHRLLAILPASSDAPESPPPTEISMKPDNGKGRRRDDVDPRTFTQRSHGELLGVEVSVKYTPGHRIGWHVRQLSNFR